MDGIILWLGLPNLSACAHVATYLILSITMFRVQYIWVLCTRARSHARGRSVLRHDIVPLPFACIHWINDKILSSMTLLTACRQWKLTLYFIKLIDFKITIMINQTKPRIGNRYYFKIFTFDITFYCYRITICVFSVQVFTFLVLVELNK